MHVLCIFYIGRVIMMVTKGESLLHKYLHVMMKYIKTFYAVRLIIIVTFYDNKF